MTEIYFSTDIETDGPIPGKYSMLSFASAAFTKEGKLLATYSANLDTLPGASQHPETMKWWASQKEAWESCRDNTRPAEEVMPEYINWVKNTVARLNTPKLLLEDHSQIEYMLKDLAEKNGVTFVNFNRENKYEASLSIEINKNYHVLKSERFDYTTSTPEISSYIYHDLEVKFYKKLKKKSPVYPELSKYNPVFVGFPTGFDFTFVYWYLIAFAGTSPFSFSALDIKTLAMSKLGIEFRNSSKRNFPKKWFGKSKHTHIALDDAIEQGELFCNILKHK